MHGLRQRYRHSRNHNAIPGLVSRESKESLRRLLARSAAFEAAEVDNSSSGGGGCGGSSAAAERSLLASLAANGVPLSPTTSTDSAISDAWHREVRSQVSPKQVDHFRELEGSSSAKTKMDMWKRREAGEDVSILNFAFQSSLNMMNSVFETMNSVFKTI